MEVGLEEHGLLELGSVEDHTLVGPGSVFDISPLLVSWLFASLQCSFQGHS